MELSDKKINTRVRDGEGGCAGHGDGRLMGRTVSGEDRRALREDAETVIGVVRGLGRELGFDERSVKVLDECFEVFRTTMTCEEKSNIAGFFGAFLGEAIIMSNGGEWVLTPAGLGIHIRDELCVFPFTTVASQLFDDADESVLSYYQRVACMAALPPGWRRDLFNHIS